VSAGSVDFGTSVDTARVRLSNPGGQPLDWSTTTGPVSYRGVASPFSFTPASGTLQPGGSVDVEFGIDRAWPSEGDVGQRVTFFAGDVSADVDLTGTIARPPDIRLLEQPPTTTCSRSGPAAVRWEAGIADETEPITTTLTVRTPSGNTVDVDVTFDISTWLASYVLDADGDGLADPGVFRWSFGATDGLGNAATVSGAIDVDPDC
jgi:hypothetical protein